MRTFVVSDSSNVENEIICLTLKTESLRSDAEKQFIMLSDSNDFVLNIQITLHGERNTSLSSLKMY